MLYGAMLVAGTVPWPRCIFPQNRCRSDDVLCTCTHVTCYATAGVLGWGGLGMMVGWVGDDDVLCTCTHVTCYATAGVVGWGGVGMTFFALAHI